MTTDSVPAERPAPLVPLALLRRWKTELLLTAGVCVALASFSSFRFLRQSEAPHFVYQSKAFLEGHTSLDPQVLPNLEDWACVREVDNVKTRCSGSVRQSDRWYSSFPFFPAVAMLPFVALHGYQFNDTSFGVIVGSLAVLAFYVLLKRLFPQRSTFDNVTLALLFCFGSVFCSIAIRGEVWFSAETMGVALTCLYLLCAVEAKRPILAGLFWSMAVLTRTPLFFTGVFFLLEALAPLSANRLQQIARSISTRQLRPVLLFAAGALPLGLLAMVINVSQFGSVTEFGHRFLFNNRVNPDIDTFGLFHPHYLLRNLEAAFLKLPTFSGGMLRYDPWGLSLFVTLPLLAVAFTPATHSKGAIQAAASMAALLGVSLLFPPLSPPPGAFPIGLRNPVAWIALAAVLAFFCWQAWRWVRSPDAPRLLAPILVTVACCAAPGLLYQNTGYAQFGFRFSLDYTPYLFLLIALGGWHFRHRLFLTLSIGAVLVNFWGVAVFRGYTETIRGW
jgi:hypothetical protein